MEKIKIGKKIRTYILIFLVVTQIISALLIYREYYLVSDTIDKEVVLAEYGQKSSFDYIINLKPNRLFEVPNMAESNQTYFTKIVDDISTTFRYDFTTKSGNDVEIKGNYIVTTILITDLWEKRYIIIPKKEFSGKDKVEFAESFSLNISEYDNMANEIFNDIGVLPNKGAKILLMYDINAVVTKDGRNNVESFSPVMTITSTKGAFNIEGDQKKNSYNNFMITESMPDLSVLGRRLVLSVILVILIISWIIVFIVSGNKEEVTDKEDIEIMSIKKKYGDLIVDTVKDDHLPDVHTITLGSIGDLAKVAIEIERPIIHKDKYIYYVYDGSTRYECTIAVDTEVEL